jgi:hypothetical protein
MKNKYQHLVLLLIAGSAFTFTAHAAQDSMSKAEARQTVEDTSPRAQYNRARKEAQAAYKEALADCQKMRGAEKTACMKEAKTNLQNDLADAKKAMSGDTSMGSSGSSTGSSGSSDSSSGTSSGSSSSGGSDTGVGKW